MPDITFDSLTLVQLEEFSDPYKVSGINYWVIADVFSRILRTYNTALEKSINDDN